MIQRRKVKSGWKRVLIGIIAIVMSLGTVACGTEDSKPSSKSSNNPASPEMVAFNTSHVRTHTGIHDFARLLVGPNGYVEQAVVLRDLDLSQPQGLRGWVEGTSTMEGSLEAMLVVMGGAALESLAMAENRAQVLGWGSERFISPVLEGDPSPRAFVLTALVVTTAGITVFRTFRAINNAVNGSQGIVTDTATSGGPGRDAVAQALRDNGVSVPDTASGEEVSAIFERQGRDVRRRVTNGVREWNADAIVNNAPHSDGADERVLADRDRMVGAAVELGEIAVTSVVAANQAVTGGVGDLLGGGAVGATADLVLTATETDPMSVVQRHVTSVVASKETVPFEEPAPPGMTADQGRRHIEDAAQGRQAPVPEELMAAADAIILELIDMTRPFGVITSLPARMAFAEVSLDERDDGGPDNSYDGRIALPGFENGEAVEALVTRAEMAPQEVPLHELGPEHPLVLDSPPLQGTLGVTFEATGPVVDGAQPFRVEVSITRVPEPTALVCDGVNAVATPRSVRVSGAGSYSIDLEVVGRASVTVRRVDTGESYVFAVRSDGAEEPDEPDPGACQSAKDHLCDRLPAVGCDISVMDTAQGRVIDACGGADAQQFFAIAPGMCC